MRLVLQGKHRVSAGALQGGPRAKLGRYYKLSSPQTLQLKKNKIQILNYTEQLLQLKFSKCFIKQKEVTKEKSLCQVKNTAYVTAKVINIRYTHIERF